MKYVFSNVAGGVGYPGSQHQSAWLRSIGVTVGNCAHWWQQALPYSALRAGHLESSAMLVALLKQWRSRLPRQYFLTHCFTRTAGITADVTPTGSALAGTGSP
ncbi:Uncharacterised protein [Serratia fonticola]|uniref:Uncharacterized protein n=1 Tax=Serratia fonticola TaxID=47917 RepID=A0A4U9WQK1_SERFO|nr:Uncharacterised protein [Serratia fonticola]